MNGLPPMRNKLFCSIGTTGKSSGLQTSSTDNDVWGDHRSSNEQYDEDDSDKDDWDEDHGDNGNPGDEDCDEDCDDWDEDRGDKGDWGSEYP